MLSCLAHIYTNYFSSFIFSGDHPIPLSETNVHPFVVPWIPLPVLAEESIFNFSKVYLFFRQTILTVLVCIIALVDSSDVFGMH